MRAEETRITAAVADRDRVIAFDRGGKSLSTQTVAASMTDWMRRGPRVALVLGGPEGLSPAFLRGCQEIWSLSAMTLAHPVARVVVAEQIYRGWSVIQGLPYHR